MASTDIDGSPILILTLREVKDLYGTIFLFEAEDYCPEAFTKLEKFIKEVDKLPKCGTIE